MGDAARPLSVPAQPAVRRGNPVKPAFIITGFGEFCGVTCNPTQQLVQWLQGQQRARHAGPAHAAPQPAAKQHTHGADEPYSIQSMSVLEVSAGAVEAFMRQQQQALLQQAAASDGAEGPQPVVLLHLGVDTQRPAISLELQAYNNANFSCPDQAGWQPRAHLIEAAPGLGVSSVRTTTLPLQELVQQLRDAGFECGVSRDAGRFVCNYTYHKSLQLTSRLQQQLALQLAAQQAAGGAGQAAHADISWPCFSLFVHVPSFQVVNEERQRAFLLHLLDLVAKWVAGAQQEVAAAAPLPPAT